MAAVRNIELVRVSEQVASLRSGGRRRHVPKDLRQQVLDLVTSGIGVVRVAEACGLSPSLLYRWRAELRRSCSKAEGARRLAVVPEQPSLPSASRSPTTARLIVNVRNLAIPTSCSPLCVKKDVVIRYLPDSAVGQD